MFHSDKPIVSKERDRLHRTEFSKQLAKAILSYTKCDNFTISLCGKWGSGKTSILNMAIEEIQLLTADVPEEKKPIIVFFNPWNYSDCTQLISQFFETIQAKIGGLHGNEAIGAVGKALQKYASVLDYTAYIPVVGPYLAPLKEIITNLGGHIAESAESKNCLAEQKEKVVQALKNQDQKIIVIIDDIDRLNNQQIRLIFQLVNSLAGFPNMIYLLSFDRNVVTRALEEEQKCNGEEYLEKIIQVLFEVPMANKNLINVAFCEMVEEIIFGPEGPDLTFSQDHWNVIFGNCISPFINSMRDVNRVINAFEFKYGLMKDEINSIDLLALTTLQVCAPEIYEWIYSKANYLCGSNMSGGGISGVEQKQNRAEYLQRFQDIYSKSPVCMLQVIQSLFPRFAWNTGGRIHDCRTEEELRRANRIASSDRIQRYFDLSLEDILITQSEIRDTIFSFSDKELTECFDSLMQSGHLLEYLNEIEAFIPEIPAERRELFIKHLTRLQSIDTNYERKGLLSPIPAYKCRTCVYEIMRLCTKSDCYAILASLIKVADETTLASLSELVISIERGYGRIGDVVSEVDQLVDEQSIGGIEQMLLTRIKEISGTKCLLEIRDFYHVETFWEFAEKDSYNIFMDNTLKDAINVPKYLLQHSGTWTTGKEKGWSFKNEDFEFITLDLAYQQVQLLKKTEAFSQLSFCFKEIAIAYSLWYEQEKKEHHQLTEKIVHEMIPLWEP